MASTQARTYGCEEGSHLLAGVLHPHEARGKPAPLPLVHLPSDSAHLDAACRVPRAAFLFPVFPANFLQSRFNKLRLQAPPLFDWQLGSLLTWQTVSQFHQ